MSVRTVVVATPSHIDLMMWYLHCVALQV